MEWVETTARTIEEALDVALDQLGVDEEDAEYEVLEEPKVGLFGRMRGDARIRARVRPTKPRAKEDRRDRRRRSGRSAASGEAQTTRGTEQPAASSEEDNMTDTGVEVPLAEQGEVAAAFLKGVLERFGVEGTIAVREAGEDTIEVAVEGSDLGLLIGPKGSTLAALQELARTVVQRKTSARNGRLLVDVAGYRQRRKQALERFAREAAEKALASGARIVLEPMTPADRKIIHDTINDISGVSTVSEGEEPRRRVVLVPEDS